MVFRCLRSSLSLSGRFLFLYAQTRIIYFCLAAVRSKVDFRVRFNSVCSFDFLFFRFGRTLVRESFGGFSQTFRTKRGAPRTIVIMFSLF